MQCVVRLSSCRDKVKLTRLAEVTLLGVLNCAAAVKTAQAHSSLYMESARSHYQLQCLLFIVIIQMRGLTVFFIIEKICYFAVLAFCLL